MLVKLCEKTESDIPNDKQLFSDHIISTQTMIKEVRALQFGKNNIDPDSERDLLISIMKQSQSQKINAIKYYRQEMNEKFSEQVSLREAKEHIDGIAVNMRVRGIIN